MKIYNYIYLIRNLINGKIYIGKHSTDNLQDGYMGSGIAIKNAYKKYGKQNFKKELLCMCVDENELNEMEIYYIAKFNSTDKYIGYNLTYGGDGGMLTDESRRKLSESLKGRKLSEETKRKLSEVNKGKTLSDETKTKLSALFKGENNPMFGIHRYGEANPMYGKHWNLSDETKAKISESMKGKNKGKPKKKCKWLTPDGEIVEMSKANAKNHHPDWILLNE